MSKPALIFFFSTTRVHTTKSTVKILAAKTHCKYFLKIAEHCQTLGEMSTPGTVLLLAMFCFSCHVARALSGTDVCIGVEVSTAVTVKSSFSGVLIITAIVSCCRVSDFPMEVLSGHGKSYSGAVT
jgi:hypothetical protein